MSATRGVSTYRRTWGPAVFPSGARACRDCGGEVGRRRRTFCSDECGRRYSIANNPGDARAAVAARDAGVCAICARDCGALDNNLMRLRWACATAWERWCVLLGLRRGERTRSTWQADHIRPVVLGGGGCDLDNLRTLCIWCHKDETRRVVVPALKRRAA